MQAIEQQNCQIDLFFIKVPTHFFRSWSPKCEQLRNSVGTLTKHHQFDCLPCCSLYTHGIGTSFYNQDQILQTNLAVLFVLFSTSYFQWYQVHHPRINTLLEIMMVEHV